MGKFNNWLIKKCGGYTKEEMDQKSEKLFSAQEEIELLRKELIRAESIDNNIVISHQHPCVRLVSNYTLGSPEQDPILIQAQLEHKEYIKEMLAHQLYDKAKEYINYFETATPELGIYKFDAELLIGVSL